MSNLVAPSSEYYGRPQIGRPVSSGQIFVGQAGTDPTIPENRVQVRAILDDGTESPVSQPLQLSPGGVILIDGVPRRVVADGSFSISVYDSDGVLVTYDPNSVPRERCELIPPAGPVDPYPEYGALINALEVGPIIWIRGWRGVINDGSGLPAAWVDFNALSEHVVDSRGLLTVGGIDTGTQSRECIASAPSNETWFFSTGPVTQTGGRGATADDDISPHTTAWDLVTLSRQFQCHLEAPGAEGAFHVIGWPIQYTIRSDNIYNQSTDPAVPVVDDCTSVYKVSEYDQGGAVLFEETVTVPGNGPSMALPARAGTVINSNVYTFIQSYVTTHWVHDPGLGDIFITCDTKLSIIDITPRMGKLCPHQMGYQPHTITVFFQYKKAHPYGIDINATQQVFGADQVNLLITSSGLLDWYTRNSDVYLNLNNGALIDGTWYAVTLVQEAVGGQPQPYQHKAWINGVKVLDENKRVWEVLSVNADLYTGGTYAGAQVGEASAAFRRPMMYGIAEYTMFDYALTDQQILDQHAALLG